MRSFLNYVGHACRDQGTVRRAHGSSRCLGDGVLARVHRAPGSGLPAYPHCRLLTSAPAIQVEDIVRWGVWLVELSRVHFFYNA